MAAQKQVKGLDSKHTFEGNYTTHTCRYLNIYIIYILKYRSVAGMDVWHIYICVHIYMHAVDSHCVIQIMTLCKDVL